MMTRKTPVIHYMNQFFAGIGAEEQASARPVWFDGPKGPGRLLESAHPELQIIGTIAAGDNFMAENLEAGIDAVLALLDAHLAAAPDRPELLLAGPAFNAGRYGMACAAVCLAVQERLAIPAVTAMYEENPAVEQYRRQVTIVRAADTVMGMQDAAAGMARAGMKLVRGETIDAAEDGTLLHGLRQNYFAASSGAERAIEMLLKKLAGDLLETEYTMPVFDRVPPAPAVKDLSAATIAVVTSGGIVPRG